MISPTVLHNAYIQSLISRRTLPESTAIELYSRLVLAVKDAEPSVNIQHAADIKGFKSFIGECAELVREFGLDFRRGFDQTDEGGKHYISVINTDPVDGATDLSKSVSDLSPLEISLYREMVLAIIDSYPSNSIGTNRALQIGSDLITAIPKSTSVSILSALVSRGWLSRSARARYSLSPRAITELEPYLTETYGEIGVATDPNKEGARDEDKILKGCFHCSKIVLAGWVCSNPECDAHIHKKCYMTRKSANRNKCKACNFSWDTESGGVAPAPIGEDAIDIREDGATSMSKRKRKRGVDSGLPDDEQEEETIMLDDDNDDEATQTQVLGRSVRPRRNVEALTTQVSDSEGE